MNVKQLKEKLENFPENMDVFIEVSNSGFTYNLLNLAEKRKIPFTDGYDVGAKADDNVIILSDDV